MSVQVHLCNKGATPGQEVDNAGGRGYVRTLYFPFDFSVDLKLK